ncbi:RNA interference and gene silencing protein (Qde2) [Penicillium capsulatum]|uniref:RNA interference and gene silencing protein (Qde2) n=1 Tax=Penicillium capsulatum TaxID=69766 RepID=A0A9W9HQR4_9EURO|nr:RNA interference and gene silencing protein (Qde2) [Penicillium capsulatum]KAJ6105846.1 RNA interference and gene silencing protein [Penicillium capsulatum]
MKSVVSLDPACNVLLRPEKHEQLKIGRGFEVLREISFQPKIVPGRALMQFSTKLLPMLRAGPLRELFYQHHGNATFDVSKLEAVLMGTRIELVPFRAKRTIAGFATVVTCPTASHPPKVKCHGAGPYDVEIYVHNTRSTKIGKYVSIAELFRQAIGCDIDATFPVVNVGSRNKPLYWPVDLCNVEPAQRAQGVALKNPRGGTLSALKDALDALGAQQAFDAVFVSFGISISKSPITVHSRHLTAPDILYNDKAVRPLGGQWKLPSKSCLKFPVRCRRWVWIWIDDPGRIQKFTSLCFQRTRKLAITARVMGVLQEAAICGVRIPLSATNIQSRIDDTPRSLLWKYEPSLVALMLPDVSQELKALVHYLCDVKHGVQAIDISSERLEKPTQYDFSFAILEANLKLGGRNHFIEKSKMRFLANGKSMVVGIASSKLTPNGVAAVPRVGCIVTSVDSTLSQWPFESSALNSDQLTIAALPGLVASRLGYWSKKNEGRLPEDIVVYRNINTSDTIESIAHEELCLIQRGCHSMYPSSLKSCGFPRIALILVDQQARLYFTPTVDIDPHGTDSPLAGTLVDRGVTYPRGWEFYLQSHYPVGESINQLVILLSTTKSSSGGTLLCTVKMVQPVSYSS